MMKFFRCFKHKAFAFSEPEKLFEACAVIGWTRRLMWLFKKLFNLSSCLFHQSVHLSFVYTGYQHAERYSMQLNAWTWWSFSIIYYFLKSKLAIDIMRYWKLSMNMKENCRRTWRNLHKLERRRQGIIYLLPSGFNFIAFNHAKLFFIIWDINMLAVTLVKIAKRIWNLCWVNWRF